jgi:hypothetical protein
MSAKRLQLIGAERLYLARKKNISQLINIACSAVVEVECVGYSFSEK